jgi:nucleotide-binding universal stress UspA family protein
VVLKYLDFFTSFVPTRAIYFLHVLPQFDVLNAAIERSAESLISNVELNQEVISQMNAEMRERMGKENNVQIDFDVREGNPLEELLRDTKERKADLVVIGQKSGTSQHGILARNMVRKMDCSALIIPDLAQTHIRKILVPVDFSGNSARALRTAVALNHRLKKPAQIIALNVYEMPNFSVYRIQKTREQLKEMIEADRQEAFKHFTQTFVGDDHDWIQTELIERESPGIAHYLMDYAEKSHVDFIVMGAKGHSKVELLLLGSVTEKVLNDNESIPALVVK